MIPSNRRIVEINPEIPVSDTANAAIAEAAGIILSGGIVVVPTLCLYGLAADALNPGSLMRIFHIKNRPETNPLLVFIKGTGDLEALVTDVPENALKLMDHFWPGKVTLVFNANPHLPDALTAGTGKIGIRVPGHPVTSALVNAAGRPITGTSANISGEKGCHDVSSLPASILDSVDFTLDAGPLKPGPGSTVIDVTTYPVKIIRQGIVPSHEIFKALP
jgi:L-threonylcarbamoyladenylate synthase